MSKETVNLSPRTLAVRFNGVFSITDRGHLAHELVRIHTALKKNADPRVQFAISEELVQEYRLRRETLCCQLGLSSDEQAREKTIQGYGGYLTRVGFPCHRVNLK